MFRRHLLVLCSLVLAPIGAASAANISFAPLTSPSIAAGGSVTFQIYGSSVNQISGFSLYLNSTGTGNQFSLTSYTINTALFDSIVLNPALPEAISATHDSQDLGSFIPDAFTMSAVQLSANTTYLLGTATVTVNASTPGGTYSVGNSVGTLFLNDNFDEDFAPGSDFFINVTAVPEPSTWGILLGGGLVGVIFSRRLARGRRSQRC